MFSWLSDPFNAVIGISIAAFLSWYASRRYRSKPKPKTRLLRTAAECIAYGVNPKYAGYAEINLDDPPPPAPRTVKQDVGLARCKLSGIADARGPVNVLVAGPKGSGKTTVLRTLLVRRAPIIAECVAIDPHNSPGKWPCAVVGGGLDWPTVDSALRTMSAAMQQRFVMLNDGSVKEGQFPLRVYVGDEFLSISQELNGKDGKAHAGKLLIERLVNGRKVGDALMVASQNDTVEALGIQGNADIKGCFDYIVYLGALVSTRAKFHGCPTAVIDAATTQERVGVVWFTERNQWFLLDFDLRPVLEGVSTSPSFVAAGIGGMVSPNVPVFAGMTPNTAHTSGDTTSNTTPNTAAGLSDEVIKALHEAGWSKNRIAENLSGSKQSRLARIAAALNEDEETAKSTNVLTA